MICARFRSDTPCPINESLIGPFAPPDFLLAILANSGVTAGTFIGAGRGASALNTVAVFAGFFAAGILFSWAGFAGFLAAFNSASIFFRSVISSLTAIK